LQKSEKARTWVVRPIKIDQNTGAIYFNLLSTACAAFSFTDVSPQNSEAREHKRIHHLLMS
jgi:hypothetical protein